MSDSETGSVRRRNLANLRESIVRDYDRLNEDSGFRFACHPGVPCFNRCCSDVNIFLTPYDVLRLKKRLRLDSSVFLSNHTLLPVDSRQTHPVVLLKMQDDSARTCPFVDTARGCTVYEDRPWACRMFPLGKASPGAGTAPDERPFYFLMHEDVCVGWAEEQEWTVRGWIENQQVRQWDDHGEIYKDLTLHPVVQGGGLKPAQMDMFYMACFDLDRFRRFVLGSTLLKRIDLDRPTLKRLQTSDEALLAFAYQWLRFALFHEPVLKLRTV